MAISAIPLLLKTLAPVGLGVGGAAAYDAFGPKPPSSPNNNILDTRIGDKPLTYRQYFELSPQHRKQVLETLSAAQQVEFAGRVRELGLGVQRDHKNAALLRSGAQFKSNLTQQERDREQARSLHAGGVKFDQEQLGQDNAYERLSKYARLEDAFQKGTLDRKHEQALDVLRHQEGVVGGQLDKFLQAGAKSEANLFAYLREQKAENSFNKTVNMLARIAGLVAPFVS